MKIKHIIFTFILFSALMWQSCEDYLEIETQQSMDAEEALSTPENIKATLIGAYLEARSRWVFGSQFNEYAELLAATDHMQHVGSHREPQSIIEKDIAVNNSYVESSWVVSYSLINTLNNVYAAAEIVEQEAERQRIRGEALFLRGKIYFELTRLWGLPYEAGQQNDQPGVPLVLEPTLGAEDAVHVARNSVEQCYAQVVEDLEHARDLLPEENGNFADTYAASAMLARVHLQKSDFEAAAEEADRVITSGRYQLNTTPMSAYNNPEPTAEDIFTLQNSLTSNTMWLSHRYGSLNGMGRGDYEFSENFLAKFDEDDLRGQLQEDTYPSYTEENIQDMYYIGVGNIRSGGINTAKWANYYTTIPLIRLAEMYLIRAEANFELQEQGQASVGAATPADDLNMLRERASAPLFDSEPGREEIRLERYLELCWEGHRLHDLKRWQEPVGDHPYDAGTLILPIPFRELETNPLLEQNPYYL